MKSKMKLVKGYAFVNEKDSLEAWGNGQEFQLPIFHARAEALSWKRNTALSVPVKLIRVEIREIVKK